MSDNAFFGYNALLVVSSVLLAAVAIGGFGQSTLTRVIDGIFAVVFLGYAFYLLFISESAEVRVVYYVFLVPIFAVMQIVKGLKARREAAAAPAEPQPAAPHQSA